MSYDRSYIRYQALISGISLLENVFDRLDSNKISVRDLSAEWITAIYPAINDQLQILMNISADDIASRYLAYRLNDLNAHLLSENSHEKYARRLVRYCLDAMFRAAQSHSHIWDEVQRQAILEALGSSHVVRTKGLPYYDSGEEYEEKKKKRYIIGKKNDEK